MGLIEICLIALGLAMDAFAVSVCKGLSINKFNIFKAIKIGLYFGFFQGIMPIIGYFLSSNFHDLVKNVDHWIAFVLLLIIGGKMIKESFESYSENMNDKVDVKTLLVLAIATSIDALAVGISFAFLNTNIYISALLIGIITLILSVIGVKIGKRFGNKFQNKAEILGGVILILIGLKILLEHLDILNF